MRKKLLLWFALTIVLSVAAVAGEIQTVSSEKKATSSCTTIRTVYHPNLSSEDSDEPQESFELFVNNRKIHTSDSLKDIKELIEEMKEFGVCDSKKELQRCSVSYSHSSFSGTRYFTLHSYNDQFVMNRYSLYTSYWDKSYGTIDLTLKRAKLDRCDYVGPIIGLESIPN